jgi:hypothetical protein
MTWRVMCARPYPATARCERRWALERSALTEEAAGGSSAAAAEIAVARGAWGRERDRLNEALQKLAAASSERLQAAAAARQGGY